MRAISKNWRASRAREGIGGVCGASPEAAGAMSAFVAPAANREIETRMRIPILIESAALAPDAAALANARPPR